ncbi:MAG: hypothetical protein VX633_06855, partial [Verrucomicrobiota bacterium]|nr:hypothetical protein [Verrucomicrobiota bacterium]
WRPQDLERAAECFLHAHATSGSPLMLRNHVYCLSRIPSRKAEAWEKCREMWADEVNRRYNTPQTIFFALQSWAGETTSSPEEILGSRRKAAQKLTDYWFRQEEGLFPMDGVREMIDQLCREFKVPERLHPLSHPPDKTFDIDPYTGKVYPPHPITGEPNPRTWRTIWMSRPRDDYRVHLRSMEAAR